MRRFHRRPYPNCWAHHKVLQAVLELKGRHGIRGDDVKAVYVDLQKDKPTYRYLNPKTVLEACYSLGYGIAAALADGELTLRQYEKERVFAPDIRALMEKIVDVPAADPAQQQVVTIEMNSGESYSGRVMWSKGHPLHDPMTLDEVKEKYRICAGRILPEKKIEASMELILHMEDVKDFSSVMDALIVD